MLRIEYSALAIGMEAGEDYFVEIQRNNGAWETVANFVRRTVNRRGRMITNGPVACVWR